MSYSICRIAKMKSGGVTGIQIHDRREKDVSHTNKDIDWSRTHENVTLIERQGAFQRAVKERIDGLDLKRAVRKDATVMVQAMITSDKAFFDGMTKPEQVEFLKKGYEFIKDRYGEENVVSATIHMDEKTPHVHVNFVPVTEDGRLSAKDLFGPKDLRTLQDDFNRYCRENGYDLERGDPESKAKHLEVAEYKLETKYQELKEKEAELQKLEQVDKSVSLDAEKGKLMYSTQEVEAIKEQNKALKLESYDKGRTIQDLEKKVRELEKQLSRAESDIGKVNVALERLKDLENESEALKGFLEKYPKVAKALELHDKQIEQAYRLGNGLHTFKQEYNQAKAELRQNIEKSFEAEKTVKELDKSLYKLSDLETKVNASQDRLKGLEDELEQSKGVFKGKQRKEITKKIETEKVSLQQSTNDLKNTFGVDPFETDRKRKEIMAKQEELRHQKLEAQAKSDQLEKVMRSKVEGYKYHKAVSDSLDKPLKEISSRRDNKASVSSQDKKLFHVNNGDRTWITNTMKEKHPQFLEKVQENWKQEDLTKQVEKEAKEMAKEQAQQAKQARGISRGGGLSR